MKNKDEEIEEILNATDSLEQSTALNKIVIKLLKINKQENIRLWTVILFLLVFNIFTIMILEYNHSKTESNFAIEQEKYLEFLKEFDYEVEIVEETEKETNDNIQIEQENDNGSNIVQTGNNSIINQ